MSEGTAEDATGRFSTRVGNYARYRPSYPGQLIDLLQRVAGLSRDDVVVDVGSGTGKLSELFLRHGNRVVGVEPNPEMRRVGECLLGHHAGFRSVAGRAEATTLGERSASLIVAGQAFHWFDAEAARVEFLRVLEPGGRVALVWNDRRNDATPMMSDYEALLREHGTDYDRVDHLNLAPDEIRRFFDEGGRCDVLPHRQQLDGEGLRGRLLSCSYVPDVGDPRCDAMLRALQRLFDRHQVGGRVTLEYDTRIHSGRPRRRAA